MTVSMSLTDLKKKLNQYCDNLEKYQDSDFGAFKHTMIDFRKFLMDSLSTRTHRITAFNYLINEDNDYYKFKVKFTHAENFFERHIELAENESVCQQIRQQHNKRIQLNELQKYLTDDFNKLFFNDVKIEIEKLSEYFSQGHPFVMVGCGSMPITILSYCQEYPNESFIGIDNSAEAISKAIEIKKIFNINNLHFDIIDGINYNYENARTIFVANTVIPKIKVLKQIAMSAKEKTKIIIRIPISAGKLISEDIEYNSISRIHFLKEIGPDKDTDDLLYKLLVLEVR